MTRIPPIVLLAVVGVLAWFSLKRVQFSASLYEMLPADLPEVQGMERLNRYFSRDGQLIVTVKAKEAFVADEAIVSVSERLEAEKDLVGEVFRELSLTELVTEGGSLLAWLWLNGEPDDLEGLASRLGDGRSSEEIAAAMDKIQNGFFDQDVVIVSYDPLGFAKLGDSLGLSSEGDSSGPDPMSSSDGTFQILYVEGKDVDFSDYRAAAHWLEKVKAVVHEWKQEWEEDRNDLPEEAAIEIGLTGTPAFMAEVGAEMEKDMTVSVFATILLISLLFWVMHKKTKPLSWLVAAMGIVLIITVNLGATIFGDLSVMSVGFAAILMGLAVDYGIVLYREARDTRHQAATLRKSVGPSIVWAAITTAVVFLSLNLSSLPGLSEMGNLVATGVVIGALVMLYFFAPVAVAFNRDAPADRITEKGRAYMRTVAGWLAVLVPVTAAISMFAKEMPGLEANFHPFRIRSSPSMIAWKQLQSELIGRENAIPTVITGRDLADLHRNLEGTAGRIQEAEADGLVNQHVLPGGFIPHSQNQDRNRERIGELLQSEDRLVSELESAGFSQDGLALTRTVFDSWSTYAKELESSAYVLPTGKLAVWSIDRLFSAEDNSVAALATIKPAEPRDRSWVTAICDENTVVASLGSLGTALNERIGQDLLRVFLPMMVLLSIMLSIVFRSWRDLLLSLFCLLFSAGVLVLLTVWTPMSWNSFNVCGLPLLFGTGLDFSIHMIFALRRNGGDLLKARHGIGKALIFCGTSSAIGFGSLATASAHGLASLGIVCAVGILVNMGVAVWLLPRWYRWLHRLEE